MGELFWDRGTAYDLFVSLDVLYRPDEFDLPGAWAAGVRARLPAAEREIVEHLQLLVPLPWHWIYTLPEPKDAAATLWVLGQIPADERLASLTLTPDWPPPDMAEMLQEVQTRGAWGETEREALRGGYQRAYRRKGEKKTLAVSDATAMLDLWAHAIETGERLLSALRAYHEVFFAEEERRIGPALDAALARGQELAERLAAPDLLEELSQGVRVDDLAAGGEMVLVPSYWCTPLMYFGQVSVERRIFLFGARPAGASLIPGELVPDALLRSLKALSDPTRLRILRYLAAEPLAPAELARRLRLRMPTVLHHLQTLRLAGLVRVRLEGEGKKYAARPGAVAAAFASLQELLGKEGEA